MFLHHNAADVCADMIESGIGFLIPDDIARLPVDKQARHRAAAEAKQ